MRKAIIAALALTVFAPAGFAADVEASKEEAAKGRRGFESMGLRAGRRNRERDFGYF
ncbi:MAG: hypothetical protein SGJ17_01325 [Hyphomicrobiales bacterium]|nr:hypothetical protein [Hyphomicrobiales bacterium]